MMKPWFLVQELRLDEMENRSSRACYYEAIGITQRPDEIKNSYVEGNGWPISRGTKMVRYLIKEIEVFT